MSRAGPERGLPRPGPQSLVGVARAVQLLVELTEEVKVTAGDLGLLDPRKPQPRLAPEVAVASRHAELDASALRELAGGIAVAEVAVRLHARPAALQALAHLADDSAQELLATQAPADELHDFHLGAARRGEAHVLVGEVDLEAGLPKEFADLLVGQALPELAVIRPVHLVCSFGNHVPPRDSLRVHARIHSGNGLKTTKFYDLKATARLKP
jgi:hypothetical protein